MHKICFYIPEENKEAVKQKMFDAGAGKVGLYDHCCWETKGTGQYRPLPGSEPTLGEYNSINRVEEYQVEMICPDDLLDVVLQTMIKNHPYEEPAYSAWPITVADKK
ncbi:MAG: NGG1p interacting factor NIF3 [Gammaproteobacteria bacterium]|nr:NGG1p interacting factor NIF3 [Gammaproteobacteria bacterium]MCH9743505.1 NGG1p interacting factor NIF3 [Gammaproteobacteria bacterium]